MDSARVGGVRDSMLKTPRKKRPTLGKTISLPGPDFVYGARKVFNDGGVAMAISSWNTLQLSPAISGIQSKGEKDFVTLNREGVKSGLVTAKELRQYHTTHDIRRHPKVFKRKTSPPQFPPDFTFGEATRSCTPMVALLEYRYAKRWLEEQQAREREMLAHMKEKARLGRMQDNRASTLRKNRPPKVLPSNWKMPRFQQIGPALETFRDPELHKRAMAAHYFN